MENFTNLFQTFFGWTSEHRWFFTTLSNHPLDVANMEHLAQGPRITITVWTGLTCWGARRLPGGPVSVRAVMVVGLMIVLFLQSLDTYKSNTLGRKMNAS